MTFWLLINSLGLIVVAAILFLTIRQVGILLAYNGPVGARSAESQGPRVGESIAAFTNPLKEGTAIPVGPELYVFLSHACAICGVVHKAALRLGPHWQGRASMVLVYDEEPKNGLARLQAVEAGVYVGHYGLLRQQIDVASVPFGVIVDAQGLVLGHGVVNATSHLESLLELTLPSEDEPGEVGLEVPLPAEDVPQGFVAESLETA